jgi:UDP-N-acetylglucosamine--N-acetylmuramyl-(pentapeptide) pyrophosphoryl-undecaprenol N-acetylglucosamine transferase
MTVLMAGGGTGGHVIPAIAVARELRARGHQPFFVGTRTGMESTIVPREGFDLELIEIGGWNRVGAMQQLRTLAQLPASILASRRYIARRRPRALFSMGGYVAAPPMIAARLSRLPIIAMEPNAIPGLVSRKLARWIDRALVSFEESRRYFRPGSVEVTGLPVRREFFNVPEKPPQHPLTVLITGGSQGSKKLNEAARESWPIFAREHWPVRFIHQAGRLTYAETAAAFEAARVPGRITEFLQDMPAAFSEADLIVCRAGAGAVAELAAAGKPAILVPFPFAADDHQARNAEAMERAGAARVLRDRDLTGETLAHAILSLSAADLTRMAAAAKAIAKPGAAARAATVIEEAAQ